MERGKENYNKILSDSEQMIVNNTKHEDKNQDSLENTADDLDFLLSCHEPVTDPLTVVKSVSLSSSSGICLCICRMKYFI